MSAPVCPLCRGIGLVESRLGEWSICALCNGTGTTERREGERRVNVRATDGGEAYRPWKDTDIWYWQPNRRVGDRRKGGEA